MSVRQLPDPVRYWHIVSAIESICRAGPPVPSTARFAVEACVSESTLGRHLRALLGSKWTPHALLETVGVLMAVDLVHQGWPLGEVHRPLGVHEDTLRSWTRRRYDASLLELCRSPTLALDQARAHLGEGESSHLTETAG